MSASPGPFSYHEFDGFKLPAVERREAVEDLRWNHGLSGEAIADALGVDPKTVANDIKATLESSRDDPPPPPTGKDGRKRDTNNIGRKPFKPKSQNRDGDWNEGRKAQEQK
ncbi:hypothetical protein [Gordonia sp. ABSL49_1]|uniref:hypothetical protein n=1 Tax=Gordonia sp. ABSL49_1 TaxID=2920941 RepID=UPI001F0DF587|nr:hypothetical protein [Gordonia sp. ABSL49_1]MCH5644157.1 hypothetical protein [Gordonia sp. ABSL49_1]